VPFGLVTVEAVIASLNRAARAFPADRSTCCWRRSSRTSRPGMRSPSGWPPTRSRCACCWPRSRPSWPGRSSARTARRSCCRPAVALVRELTPDPAGRCWCSRTCTGPTPRASACSAAWPSVPTCCCWSGRSGPRGWPRHLLVELLAELERQRLITTTALERLGRDGVAELLGAVYRNPVPFQVAEALHRRTGGNPFFLEELVVTPATLTRPGWPPCPCPGT
jgi:hypothetical protein